MSAVEIAAVCDIDVARAQTTCEQFGIARSYADVEEMLNVEQPDFVDIITRPETHLELVQNVATRGIPVICQKPLAPTIDQARQIVEVAAAEDVLLMVHDNFRFQPWHREIKRLVEAGAIGDRLHSLAFRSRPGDGWQEDAYLARQPYFREMPRLLIYETGVHFIDTFRFLAGDIDGVYAVLRRLNPEIKGEDAGVVFFEFASGAHGIWDANRFNESTDEDPRHTFGEFLVEGNGGSLRLYGDGRITIQELGGVECEHKYQHERRGFAGDCVLAAQRHFIESLLSGTDLETSGEEYLKTLRVQEAIYESAQLGQPVRGLTNNDNS